ncbi:PulJ/GspJ family protein [Roseiconus lacunae]|uniref:PulJ/GspJ family protein n=1 Tax=Roseiconus lacunae TaxID=2605694 RepID=UPI0011F38A7D|nr:hypothetical protein [Roseiconus lacunae]
MSGSRRATAEGMTLIELTVALVLASMLMVVLLRVTNLVVSETVQVRRNSFDRLAAERLADQLRFDFENARGVGLQTNTIILDGFVGPNHVASRVYYEVQSRGAFRVLVRSVEDESRVCWVGCGDLQFEPLGEFSVETGDAATGGLMPLPDRFRVQLADSSGRLMIREVIRHHAN